MKTNSKAFKRGGMAIVTVIAAIIIAILLNVIVTTINDRFPFSVDLTANSDYTINLDGEYEQYVKNVSSDIKVTVCAPEDDFEGSTYVNAMVPELRAQRQQRRRHNHVQQICPSDAAFRQILPRNQQQNFGGIPRPQLGHRFFRNKEQIFRRQPRLRRHNRLPAPTKPKAARTMNAIA